MSIQPHFISEFRRQGIIHPLPVLSLEKAGEYRVACDELETALGGSPRTVEVRQMHLHFPWAYELSTNKKILDHVEALLGPDLVIWATELFSKHPGDKNRQIGWHRDGGYMGFQPEDVLTAWVALSESVVANGCMQAIPGAERFDAPNQSDHRLSEADIDREQTINIELQPGEMSIHDSLILHGSSANLSTDNKRVGFVIRYVQGNAKPLQGRPLMTIARGKVEKPRL